MCYWKPVLYCEWPKKTTYTIKQNLVRFFDSASHFFIKKVFFYIFVFTLVKFEKLFCCKVILYKILLWKIFFIIVNKSFSHENYFVEKISSVFFFSFQVFLLKRFLLKNFHVYNFIEEKVFLLIYFLFKSFVVKKLFILNFLVKKYFTISFFLHSFLLKNLQDYWRKFAEKKPGLSYAVRQAQV